MEGFGRGKVSVVLGDEVGLIGLGDKEGCEEGGEPGGDRIPAPGDSSNSDLTERKYYHFFRIIPLSSSEFT